jgi:hypothetical protein
VAADAANFVDPTGRAPNKDVTQMSCPELVQKIVPHNAAMAKLRNDERQLQEQGKGHAQYDGMRTSSTGSALDCAAH